MLILLFAFIPFLEAIPSCLHLRSHCLRNPLCSKYFESFETTCGYSLTRCSIVNPSNCVRDLRAIREFIGYGSCGCYRAVGYTEECDFFRQLLWNHPCERLLLDAGEERAMSERDSVTPLPSPDNRRSTRTPVADRVHQLVQQLNGELQTKSKLERGTCNEALDQVCMRHVSCRQLWRLFRSSCGVDQDNRCTMTDREVCWQSFEGLSWTGLGNCHCDTTNPDCHWIRLLTNYNKCIYEISLTKTGSYQEVADRTAEDYRRRFEARDGQREDVDRQQQERQRLEQERNRTPWNQGQQATDRPTENYRRRMEQQQNSVDRIDQERQRHQQQQQTGNPTSHRDNYHQPNYQQSRNDYNSQRTQEVNQNRIWQGRIENNPYGGQESYSSNRYETHRNQDDQRNRVWHVQHYVEPQTTTTPTTTSTTTTTTTPPPTTIPRIRVTQRTPVRTTAMAVVRTAGLRASIKEKTGAWHEGDHYYRPLFNGQSTPPPDYYTYSTSAPYRKYEVATTSYMGTTYAPRRRTTSTTTTTTPAPTHPPPIFFSTLSPFTRSTCSDAVARCEAADECRWHLGELRARCGRANCRREDCASALQRFASYVPPANAEPVMFCQCSQGDSSCQSLQELFYSPCLYKSPPNLPTCSQSAQKCASDVRCRSLRDQLLSACPLSNGECVGRSLSDCRRVLLAARGSILEQPCFCPLNDVSCMVEQRMMIPSHPCIERAMRDLSLNEPSVPETTGLVHRDNYKQEQIKEEPSIKVIKEVDIGSEKTRESSRNKYRGRTTTSTTTTSTTMSPTTVTNTTDTGKISHRSKHKTTMQPPPPTEQPPPWETTTMATITTTEEYITAPPPPAEGCQARDASGRTVFFPMGTVMRRYVDWSGRCSSWCECTAIDQLSCERLPCLEDGFCEAPLTTIEFGERIFLKERGACFCESSNFICELPDEMPELYPGLYVAAGYSATDVEMLRKEVPSLQLEKAGLMSEPAKDIGSRLQIAFERLQPESLQCRLVLMSELSETGYAFFRVEWWGLDERFNHTKTKWHHDGSEKVCSPSVVRLADLFSNSDSLRYQLVLSTVKQVKVIDYLDGLPSFSTLPSVFLSLFIVCIVSCLGA